MENDKQTFNELMDQHIRAVNTMTQEQIDACAWLMGGSGAGWNKQNMVAEFEAEKYDVPAEKHDVPGDYFDKLYTLREEEDRRNKKPETA